MGIRFVFCVRSYALGVPFRYGLAAALFALAAVLFADWDRSRGTGARRTPLMQTVEPVRFSSPASTSCYSYTVRIFLLCVRGCLPVQYNGAHMHALDLSFHSLFQLSLET